MVLHERRKEKWSRHVRSIAKEVPSHPRRSAESSSGITHRGYWRGTHPTVVQRCAAEKQMSETGGSRKPGIHGLFFRKHAGAGRKKYISR
jgi:hypothetical protein